MKEKIKIVDRILTIDRRWIYLLVLVVVIIPTIVPLGLPVYITKDVLGVWNKIESIPEGSTIFVTIDYEPGSTPEMDPMAKAILTHCFMRKLQVVAISYFVDGAGVGETLFKDVTNKFKEITGKELVKGTDYVFLGYKPGNYAMIINLTQDIYTAAPEDHYGNITRDLPIMKNNKIQTLADFPYIVVMHDDAYLESWIIYGQERTGVKMASCCTAIMATGSYPFLNAGQITGVVGGLKGASEYEKLVNDAYVIKFEDEYNKTHGEKAKFQLLDARKGMDSQSVIHIMLIFLMALGNIAFLIKQRNERKERLNK